MLSIEQIKEITNKNLKETKYQFEIYKFEKPPIFTKLILPSDYEINNSKLIDRINLDIKKEEGFHYLFTGKVGCGKSYLADIINKNIKRLYNIEARWINADEIYQKYLNFIDATSVDKIELMNSITHSLRGKFVIFDDIGNEFPNTTAAHEFIGMLMNDGYKYWKRGYAYMTIYITNLRDVALNELYDDRVMDRIYEKFLVVPFKKISSYRHKKFEILEQEG